MKLKMNSVRVAVLNLLKGAEAPMTLAEMSTALGFEVKSGSLSALLTAGVLAKGEDAIVEKPAVREVNAYVLGSVTDFTDKFKSTETRAAILDALAKAEAPMSLKDLSDTVGATVQSGTVNGLVKAGMVAVADEKVKVQSFKKAKVATYVLGNVTVDATEGAEVEVGE